MRNVETKILSSSHKVTFLQYLTGILSENLRLTNNTWWYYFSNICNNFCWVLFELRSASNWCEQMFILSKYFIEFWINLWVHLTAHLVKCSVSSTKNQITWIESDDSTREQKTSFLCYNLPLKSSNKSFILFCKLKQL